MKEIEKTYTFNRYPFLSNGIVKITNSISKLKKIFCGKGSENYKDEADKKSDIKNYPTNQKRRQRC